MKNPLLTIVIPTKNRSIYCIEVIKTILSTYPYQDFEIVVQDNSITNELERNIPEDNKLKYFYTEESLSFIENFNKSIENSSGKYLCLIGDDDGVCDDLFKATIWANDNNVDSLCPKSFIGYLWPDQRNPGKFVIPYFTNKMWKNKPKENLQALINTGIVNYMDFNLPKLYHGIIKKECMDEIKNHTGSYFGGLTPDIYSSIALSCVVKNHVVLDRPLTIAGACPKSATVDSTKGRHSGSLKNAPHFNNRGAYIWDNNVPEFYSVQTIWAESAIKAMNDFGLNLDLLKLNKSKILASSILAAPVYKKYFFEQTYKKIKENKLFFKFKTYYHLSETYLSNLINKVYYRVPRKYFLRQIRMVNIHDIKHVTEFANEELARTNFVIILKNFKGNFRKI